MEAKSVSQAEAEKIILDILQQNAYDLEDA